MSIQNNSWAISDTHFGHDNVIIYDKRPFKTGEEMDEAMIKNWNSVVKPNDTIYHLGDFAFLHESMICKILDRLNGNKILITGNHDKQMKKDCVRKYFKIITPYLEVYQNKQLICMFHYPQARWNKSHRGSFHIHGHEHGNYVYPEESRAMDVGAPCIDYTPINLNEVMERLIKFPPTKHH